MHIIRNKKTNCQVNGTVVTKVVFKQLENLEANRRQPANSTLLPMTFSQSSIFQLFYITCSALWVWISSARLQHKLQRCWGKRFIKLFWKPLFFKVTKARRTIFTHKHSFLAVHHCCQSNMSCAQHGISHFPSALFCNFHCIQEMGLTRKSAFKRFSAKDKLIHENFIHTLNIPQHDNNLTFYPICFSKSECAHSLPLLHGPANTHSLLSHPVPQAPCISSSSIFQLTLYLISLNDYFRYQPSLNALCPCPCSCSFLQVIAKCNLLSKQTH